MSNAVEIVERRLESLKQLNVTSGNETVVTLLIEYLDNLKDELKGKPDEAKLVEEEKWEIEAKVEGTKLVPLPW